MKKVKCRQEITDEKLNEIKNLNKPAKETRDEHFSYSLIQ